MGLLDKPQSEGLRTFLVEWPNISSESTRSTILDLVPEPFRKKINVSAAPDAFARALVEELNADIAQRAEGHWPIAEFIENLIDLDPGAKYAEYLRGILEDANRRAQSPREQAASRAPGAPSTPLADQGLLNAYYYYVERTYNLLPRGRARRRPLADLYIEPRLTEHFIRPDQRMAGKLPKQPTPIDSILGFDVLSSSGNATIGFTKIVDDIRKNERQVSLVITGSPGVGKTTFLSMLAVTCARERSRIPVFIELGRTARDLLESTIETYLAKRLGDFFDHIDERAIRAGLREQKFLLLFDGLDEIVVASQRINVARAIDDMLNRYPVDVVVTSRTSSYSDDQIQCDAHELLPLDLAGIKEYIDRWFEDANGVRARELRDSLDSSLRLRQLLSTPLLLSMTVDLAANTPSDQPFIVPDRRVELYQRFVKHLLDGLPNERRARQEPAAAGAQPTADDLARYLEYMAWTLHTQQYWYGTESTMIDAIRGAKSETSVDTARNQLNELEREIGLVQRVAYERYGFSHFTFQEFFAARYLARHGHVVNQGQAISAVEQLVSRAHQSWWREVIVIFSEFFKQTSLFDRLLDEPETIFLNYTLLLVDCLTAGDPSGERAYVFRKAHDRLARGYHHLPYHRLLKETIFRAIVRLGSEECVAFLREELRQPDAERSTRAIEALGDLGTPEAVDLLVREYGRPSLDVRTAYTIIKALIRPSPDDALGLLHDWLRMYRALADSAIGQFLQIAGSPGVDLLIALIDDPGTLAWLREAALLQLVSRESPAEAAIERFARALDAASDRVEQATRLLAAFNCEPNEAIAQHAAALLESNHRAGVGAAARVLARKPQPDLLENLFGKLIDCEDAGLRQALLEALSQIKDPRTEELILIYLDDHADEQDCVRDCSAALGRCGGVESFNKLARQLHDELDGPLAGANADAVVAALGAIAKRKDKERKDGERATSAAREPTVSPALARDLLRYIELAPAETPLDPAIYLLASAAADPSIDLTPLLDIVRARIDIGLNVLQHWHDRPKPNSPPRLMIALAELLLSTPNQPTATRIALRMKLAVLSETERRSYLLQSLQSPRLDLCIAALEEARAYFDPDMAADLPFGQLIQHGDAQVVEKTIVLIGEIGRQQHVELLMRRLAHSQYQQQAYAALYALVNRLDDYNPRLLEWRGLL